MEGTFSICALDPNNGDLGIAVASRTLAVGARVPFAIANLGAVVTQSMISSDIGYNALHLLQQGHSPDQIITELLQNDPSMNLRQIGIINSNGYTAAYTGYQTRAWAGHKAGPNYSAQGNILVSGQVIENVASAFEISRINNPTFELAQHLLVALEAGQMAGGDKRGQQSAALLVVREGAGPNRSGGDRYIDLRVDDHATPIAELKRLLYLRLTFPW